MKTILTIFSIFSLAACSTLLPNMNQQPIHFALSTEQNTQLNVDDTFTFDVTNQEEIFKIESIVLPIDVIHPRIKAIDITSNNSQWEFNYSVDHDIHYLYFHIKEEAIISPETVLATITVQAKEPGRTVFDFINGEIEIKGKSSDLEVDYLNHKNLSIEVLDPNMSK